MDKPHATPERAALTLKGIADEVRSWPKWLRTSTSAANQAREKEQKVRPQRERIEDVQQQLHDLLLSHDPTETSDDDEAITLIRQADEALSLAWKLAARRSARRPRRS